MITSAEQLSKYKAIKEKLKKSFPKGAGYTGFTVNIFYGGNKEVDISRVSVGGVASEQGRSDEFLTLINKSVDDNIDFWQKCVIRDIKELEESLKK